MPRGAPTMLTPAVGMLVMVVVLLAANGPGHCQSYDEDDEYEDGCHPDEADQCFTDVNDNLMCNLGKAGARNCTNRDAQDLCESMRDALECCKDILDSCTVPDGLATFSVWLAGLQAVHSHLCVEDQHLKLISDLLKGSNCFRLKRFISCVEEGADLTHVANLLTTHLDLHECNRLQVAVAACIEDSEKNKAKCRGKAQAVNEALIVFFSSTACGRAPPPPTAPTPQPCVPPTASGPRQDETSETHQDNTETNNNNNITNNENSSSSRTSNENSTTTNKSSNSNTTTTTTTTESDTTTTTTTTTTDTPDAKESTNSSSSSSSRENSTAPNKSSTSNSSSSTTKTTASTSTSRRHITCPAPPQGSGTPTASTVVVTVLVTLVVAALVAMVLVKRGILTIRTDLDRRLVDLNEADANSAYDRF